MKTLQISTTTNFQISRLLLASIIFMVLSMAFSKLNAQTTFQAIPVASTIKVLGSSNLHDWTMIDERPTASAVFSLQDGKISDLTGLTFSMLVKELKSKEDLLNTRAYKAMEADKYTNISFKLTSATISPLPNNHFQIKAYGKLQICGVTKDVILIASAIQNADKSVSCGGTEKLKMSDYGIAPPSFMFGALKVVDEVSINFNLKFKN